MRIAFLGSPDFALPTLEALIASGHDVVSVYSQPPKPRGRGQKLMPTPVHALADKHNIMVRTPKTLKDLSEQSAFRDLNLDVAIVVAYGLILPNAILEAPKYGCINVHPSLLPRWRGAAPIQRCIEAGDTKSSVQIMAMDEGLDTGAIYLSQDFEITTSDTYGILSDKCAKIGAELILKTLSLIEKDGLKPIAQQADGITYANKITKEEARIDWAQKNTTIDFKIRGFSPLPAAWTMLGDVRYKILNSEICEICGPVGEFLDDNLLIGCGNGSVRITKIQREGKSAQSADEFIKSNPIPKGSRFD